MTPSRFLVVLALAGCLASVSRGASLAARQPNIIFVLTDDQGYGDVSAHGHPVLRTPNLDRLHDEGVRFTDFHVSPTCSPTRSALLTGRHEFKNGVTHTILERERLTLSATTLAQVLKQAGYTTGVFGKWHLGDERRYQPERRGFDETFIHGGGGIGQTYPGSCGDAPGNTYFDPVILHNGRFVRTRGYCTDVFFGQALAWIESVKGTRPFFAYLPCNAPHAPLQVRPEDEARYAGKVSPRAAKYLGMVANIDDNVGRLLAKLAEWNLERDTLVVFMNDNGTDGGALVPNANAGMRGKKGTAYLGGTRASSFWRWPGTLRPADCDALTAHIDFFPTLAEIAGAPMSGKVRAQVEGRSLVPLLEDPSAPWGDRTLFTHFGRWAKGASPDTAKYRRCSVREKAWHLVSADSATTAPQWQLFHLPDDPGEQTDVATAHPEVVARLSSAFEAWWDSVQPMLVNEDAVGPRINPFKARYWRQFGGGATEEDLRLMNPEFNPATAPRPANRRAAAGPPMAPEDPIPFGADFPQLDSWAVGEWWNHPPTNRAGRLLFRTDVPRDEVVAFAVYTHDAGTLKLTAQLYPLKPGEPRVARLELRRGGRWTEVARAPVEYPGWHAHFRLHEWDPSKDVSYRVRHGERAQFEGLIRRDPIEKDEIVVATLSCNSSSTPGQRTEIVDNLKAQNPDLLFFAGDQTYRHTEHTVGWLEFGTQFREVLRDRPVITIPDDHDIGQGNLWGENGKKAATPAGSDGGYFYAPAYVNMVQRQQTWHLPDPVDPTPVERGITVYFTRLRVGGIDFAILEDRKFKSGPEGKIPKLGPRPDHINDPAYDRRSIDLPGLKLLGDRQLRWLDGWTADWSGAELKCVLSQTAFCGAVHLHGSPTNRLLADLDCNGWPQSGRNAALTVIRRAWAPHLCGDQHLAVVVKHGIEHFRDGPWAFTSPALVNTIYGRWWHPADEQPGPNATPGSPLPWTGDFLDGLGNPFSLIAYANPVDTRDERQRGDGYGLARFRKRDRTVTFECWPRFAKVSDGNGAQYPGWPVTVRMDENDGRASVGHLPELQFPDNVHPVVQVIEEASGEVLYTVRIPTHRFRAPVYAKGSYTVKVGLDRPDRRTLTGLRVAEGDSLSGIRLDLW